jgi:hypothetical protein
MEVSVEIPGGHRVQALVSDPSEVLLAAGQTTRLGLPATAFIELRASAAPGRPR